MNTQKLDIIYIYIYMHVRVQWKNKYKFRYFSTLLNIWNRSIPELDRDTG